ncbi:chemotaxis protein CheB [Pseudomonas sp. RIT-PI-S]|uniref:chemotaxis protein CheB n=1 Tax=Pseudomonas sp. RIT-PI-S TaxID=3035295 RepID=UPI0021DA1303|nr:chemotaxis protein CheB [Pseudomonas sp. RIT-PI-S]
MTTIPPEGAPDDSVQIVGVGASAGGLKALEHLLRGLPADSGLAFVIIQHLSSTHSTLLVEILARCTPMPVAEAKDGTVARSNHVYTIPSSHDLLLEGSTLRLVAKVVEGGSHLPIDSFFRSLARERGARAIGVVLSGSGADGTLGCQAIAEAGGYTLAQLPDEADYDSMPSSVIAAGNSCAVARLKDMPELLLSQHLHPSKAVAGSVEDILQTLREATGHDFTHYKKSTIERRIERRMSLHRFTEQAGYVQYLKDTPAELPLLFDELLINVTSFFRDAEAFEALKNRVLRPMLENKPHGYVFRAWVAGCATGEEAYSLAMLLQELRSELLGDFDIQLYATDLDADAIRIARAGLYPLSAGDQVPPRRLRAWFTREEQGYRVRSELRKLVVFAVHNVVSDPPFTRLDLLCCRNLLIYLGARLQQQVIPAFHYALKPKGVLFLSPSESIGQHGALFTPLDRRWKLYEAVKASRPSASTANSPRGWIPERMNKALETPSKMVRTTSIDDLIRRMLLQDFVPTSVATDLRGNIVYVHGDTGDYLRPAPGQATLNVIEMAREGLQADLRAAIHTAASGGSHSVVRRQVRFGAHTATKDLCLSVRHLTADSEEPTLLISFEPLASDNARQPAANQPLTPLDDGQITELERALANTRENLQATIDELQISNEEFCSTNEELQSANEELQSTNEELETSREELQSVNEELITVNAELQAKVEQLFDMQNDMKNLLDSINIGAIFLDTQLCIRRFTRDAISIYRLISKDIGRSLGDITSHLVGADLMVPAKGVLDTLIPYECEVCTHDDHWYLARLMPYRTLDNVIEGVVLTFHDITSRVATERSVQAARALAEAVINTVREPLLVLDHELMVMSASQSYCETFHTRANQVVGRPLLELGGGAWNIQELKNRLSTIVESDTSFTGFCIEQLFPGLGLLEVQLDARRVIGDGTRPHLILLAMQINRRSRRGQDEETTAQR